MLVLDCDKLLFYEALGILTGTGCYRDPLLSFMFLTKFLILLVEACSQSILVRVKSIFLCVERLDLMERLSSLEMVAWRVADICTTSRRVSLLALDLIRGRN